jgi:hypothetical protein
MSVTLDWTSVSFVRWGKKIERSSDGGVSGGKKCKQCYGCTYGGVWLSLRLAGVCSQAIGFVLVHLAGI